MKIRLMYSLPSDKEAPILQGEFQVNYWIRGWLITHDNARFFATATERKLHRYMM